MRRPLAACAAIVLVLGAANVRAESVTFTGTSGGRSASANFALVGGKLEVTLTNLGSAVTADPANLTGVFFDVSGSPTFLRDSVALGPGSQLVTYTGGKKGPIARTDVTAADLQYLPAEWAYKQIASGSPRGYGLSAAGLGIFGPPDTFASSPNYGASGVGGPDFGVLPLVAGANVGVNAGLQGIPLIENSVILRLIAPGGFQLSQISHVDFQYGTTYNSMPSVPAPSSLVGLAGMGAAGAAIFARRRMRARKA